MLDIIKDLEMGLVKPDPSLIDNHPFKSINKTFMDFDNHKIKLFETIDPRKLEYIIDNAKTLKLNKLFDSMDNKDIDSQITILRKYLKKIKNGRIAVQYKQNDQMGRYFAHNGLSLQSLSKVVRHTISKDFYTDIDIDNAHPVILAQYCVDNNIPHYNLRKYISNREEILRDMSPPTGMGLDRAMAKKKMLSLMNGGLLTESENDICPDSVRNFYNEMLITRNQIMTLNPDIKKIVQRKKKEKLQKDWNLDGAVMNRILCNKENSILLTMFNFFKSKDFSPDCLVFDGFMLKKDGKNPELFLDECSDYIKHELGININLSIKDMDSDIKVPEDYRTKKAVEENLEDMKAELKNRFGDFNLAKLFNEIYGDSSVRITSQKYVSCFIWSKKLKLWVDKKSPSLQKKICKVLSAHLQIEADELWAEFYGNDLLDELESKRLLFKCQGLDGVITRINTVNCCKNICHALSGNTIDPDFETKIINKNTDELPIKNGKLINLRNLKVRPRTQDDYWSFECPVDYLGEDANLSSVIKFFSDISCGSKDLIDYHRRLWGYLMCGSIADRSIHIFWGNGCNGKSSVVNIFKNITSDFTVNLSEDIMMAKKSRGASPEMMDLLFGRCGIIPESDKSEELNSKRIKTITGDDVINARHLFGHPVKFQTQVSPIWSTNFKPKINIDDQAILDRVKLIPFLGRFENTQENTAYIKDLQTNKLDEFFTFFCTGARDWYSGQSLIPCKEMKVEMDKYIAENDIVAEFVGDTYNTLTNIEYTKLPPTDKSGWVINFTYIYGEFVSWVSENNRRDDMLGKKEFKILLSKRVINRRTNKIKCGFILQKKENDESDIPDPTGSTEGLPPL